MSAFSPDTAPKKKPFSLQLDPSLFEPASAAEKEQHDVMRESTTFFRDGMRRLVRNPLAMLSIAVLLILLVTILIAPMIVPYGYSEVIRVGGQRDRTTNNMRPFQYSEKEQEIIDAGGKVFPHIFGTDELGRDYFIRVVFGARVSLAVGFFASIIVLMIGMTIATIATSVVAPATRHHQSGQCGSGKAAGMARTSAVAQTSTRVATLVIRVTCDFARVTKCSP